MFATIELTNDTKWGISLYRIINIKDTDAKKINEFSSIKYSTKPMISERLVLNYDEGTDSNENYWYTTNPTSDYKFNYDEVDSDRCWGLTNGKVSTKDGEINYTNYTLIVNL
jgi:hypothetical protein